MKFLVIGDTHCKPDNLVKIKQLFIKVESYDLPVIWLGDLLDTKDIVRAQCLNAYYKYFSTSKQQHIVLVGNHDYTTADCKEHSLEPLKALKNVKIVDKAFRLENTLFLPYFRDNNLLRQELCRPAGIKFIVGHIDIKSFDYGNGFISEEGIHPDELAQYELVISGHYHKFQNRGNIVYLGTPFSHNFGEANQDKYLGIFDDEPMSFNVFKTTFPQHITLELNAMDTNVIQLNPSNYNRVIVKGTKEELDAFDYTPYKQFKVVQECISGVVKSELKETETPEVLYSKWFKDIKKQEDTNLFNLGLDILKDSR